MVHNFVKFCTWNILLQQACSVFSAKLYSYVHFTIQLKLWVVSQKCWLKVGVTRLLGISVTNVRTLNQIHMFHILCMYKLYTRVCIHVIYTFVSPSMGLLVIIWGARHMWVPVSFPSYRSTLVSNICEKIQRSGLSG